MIISLEFSHFKAVIYGSPNGVEFLNGPFIESFQTMKALALWIELGLGYYLVAFILSRSIETPYAKIINLGKRIWVCKKEIFFRLFFTC